MPKSSRKSKEPKPRNAVALAARMRRAGPHKDGRLGRGGATNKYQEYIAIADEEAEWDLEDAMEELYDEELD